MEGSDLYSGEIVCIIRVWERVVGGEGLSRPKRSSSFLLSLNSSLIFDAVWNTPVDEIGDFGLGIYLYFKMLLTLILTISACILFNIPAMQHYNGKDYPKSSVSSIALSVGGNAVCQKLVPVCVAASSCTCTIQEFAPADGVASREEALFSISGENCYLKTACDMNFKLANWDMAMLLFLVIGLFLLAKYQNKIVEEADEAEQTAQDYSIMVQDPDADATNPDEWQQFFSQVSLSFFFYCS